MLLPGNIPLDIDELKESLGLGDPSSTNYVGALTRVACGYSQYTWSGLNANCGFRPIVILVIGTRSDNNSIFAVYVNGKGFKTQGEYVDSNPWTPTSITDTGFKSDLYNLTPQADYPCIWIAFG